ncbi:MAG: glycosyl transferase family 2 [Pseudomonadota bacterium]
MITVVIPTSNDERPLARMLPPLVHELIHGPVTDVIVYDQASSDSTLEVCEIAGCACVDATRIPLADALKKARANWLLFLPPGAVLAQGWSTHVAEYIDHQQGGGAPAVFKIATDPTLNWWQRLFRSSKAQHPVLPKGYLVSYRQAQMVLAQGGTTIEALVRGRATKRLRAEIQLPLPNEAAIA